MTGDPEKDAVLADRQQSIQAVQMAIVNQDPLDEKFLYYYEVEAAAQTQKYIQDHVDANARTTGSLRFYKPVVNVSDTKNALLVYWEDQSKAFDPHPKSNKIDKRPVNRNSHILCSLLLRTNDLGAWAVVELTLREGARGASRDVRPGYAADREVLAVVNYALRTGLSHWCRRPCPRYGSAACQTHTLLRSPV